ncbi:MAG TPA: hypothetical protein VFE47_14240, partial [Tepidisphaeraceae bacterium]|nr:hypothetical protein [Tepidisphaeraceae bacterium]
TLTGKGERQAPAIIAGVRNRPTVLVRNKKARILVLPALDRVETGRKARILQSKLFPSSFFFFASALRSLRLCGLRIRRAARGLRATLIQVAVL